MKKATIEIDDNDNNFREISTNKLENRKSSNDSISKIMKTKTYCPPPGPKVVQVAVNPYNKEEEVYELNIDESKILIFYFLFKNLIY